MTKQRSLLDTALTIKWKGIPKVINHDTEGNVTWFKYRNGAIRFVSDYYLSANEKEALRRIGATIDEDAIAAYRQRNM